MPSLRPLAKTIRTLPDYCLEVVLDNGETGTFDVKPYIKGEWFSELKDLSVFRRVYTNGFTVEWPDGQDICPDELYYKSIITDKKEAEIEYVISDDNSYGLGYVSDN